jgi:predicted LPLAT superfamily acyltransferase
MAISDKRAREAPMTFLILTSTFPDFPFSVILLLPTPLQLPFSHYRKLKNPSL